MEGRRVVAGRQSWLRVCYACPIHRIHNSFFAFNLPINTRPFPCFWFVKLLSILTHISHPPWPTLSWNPTSPTLLTISTSVPRPSWEAWWLPPHWPPPGSCSPPSNPSSFLASLWTPDTATPLLSSNLIPISNSMISITFLSFNFDFYGPHGAGFLLWLMLLHVASVFSPSSSSSY